MGSEPEPSPPADGWAAEEELSRFMLSAPEVEWIERLETLEAAGVTGEVIHLLWITATIARDHVDRLVAAYPLDEDGLVGVRARLVESLLSLFRRRNYGRG